jgi:hypothetical protein
MQYLRVFATFLLLVAAVPAISRADENPSPEALQAANELFSVLSPDLMKQITTQMDNLIWPLLEQKARADKIDDATTCGDHEGCAADLYARRMSSTSSSPSTKVRSAPGRCGNCREFVATITPRLRDMQQQSVDGFNDILRQHGYLK